MTIVNYFFETNSKEIAQALSKELAYGILQSFQLGECYCISGNTVLRGFNKQICNLGKIFSAFPNAYAKFTYSFNGWDGVCINQNGKLQEMVKDCAYIPHERLDGCEMIVTVTTDSDQVVEKIRKFLAEEQQECDGDNHTMYFNSCRCRQLIDMLSTVNERHNTVIEMTDYFGLPYWSLCKFQDGQRQKKADTITE